MGSEKDKQIGPVGGIGFSPKKFSDTGYASQAGGLVYRAIKRFIDQSSDNDGVSVFDYDRCFGLSFQGGGTVIQLG
jgi:hypothetical protein